MELPASPGPTTAGTNGLHLSGYILADVKLLLSLRESAAGNLQKQAALASSLHDMYNNTDSHTGSAVRPGYQRPLCSTPSSVDSEKSSRKKTTSNDNCPMERQDTA